MMRFIQCTDLRIVLVCALLLLTGGGCERFGPIEVVDETSQEGSVEVISTVPPVNNLFDDEAADSAGIVQTVPHRIYAELLLADAATDRDTGMGKATLLARAVFYSKNDTFRVNGFVGMRSLPAGTVTLDGVRLRVVDARVDMPTEPARDTMVGVRYQLVSHHEGFGAAGLAYQGRHTYRWVVSGSSAFPACQAEITAPPRLRVTSPAPDENISRQNDLRVQWQGGGDSVRAFFAEPAGSGGGLRVMMQFRVRKNDGAIVIPAAMLRLLPPDRNKVVLVLTSEASRTITVSGYPDDVLVRALTTHNVTVRLRR